MKIKKIYEKHLLRPLIYLTAFRTMIALIFLLILVRFVPNGPAPSMICGFLTMLFALFAYLVYLRMDGLKIPRMKYFRSKKKADPLRSFSSMADHTDDEPGVTFEELDTDEKDFCSLAANLINLIIFAVSSFIL